jgi:hypothetical protein
MLPDQEDPLFLRKSLLLAHHSIPSAHHIRKLHTCNKPRQCASHAASPSTVPLQAPISNLPFPSTCCYPICVTLTPSCLQVLIRAMRNIWHYIYIYMRISHSSRAACILCLSANSKPYFSHSLLISHGLMPQACTDPSVRSSLQRCECASTVRRTCDAQMRVCASMHASMLAPISFRGACFCQIAAAWTCAGSMLLALCSLTALKFLRCYRTYVCIYACTCLHLHVYMRMLVFVFCMCTCMCVCVCAFA